jgi:ABC-type uncharacterized transport system ATPase subunit
MPGKPIPWASPTFPEERIKYGIVPNLLLYENSVLKQHRDSPFSNWLQMNYGVIRDHAGPTGGRFPGGRPERSMSG